MSDSNTFYLGAVLLETEQSGELKGIGKEQKGWFWDRFAIGRQHSVRVRAHSHTQRQRVHVACICMCQQQLDISLVNLLSHRESSDQLFARP